MLPNMEAVIENMLDLLELHECDSLEEFANHVYENTENNLVVGYVSGYSDHIPYNHENPEEVNALFFYTEKDGPLPLLQFPFNLEEFNNTMEQ